MLLTLILHLFKDIVYGLIDELFAFIATDLHQSANYEQ